MKYILYILLLNHETGMAIDSQVFADEQACEGAKQIILDEIEQGRRAVNWYRTELKALCIPTSVGAQGPVTEGG